MSTVVALGVIFTFILLICVLKFAQKASLTGLNLFYEYTTHSF